MSTFAKGMQVWFDTPEGRVTGTVMRVNKKTVSVAPAGREDGNYYRVPPSALHVLEATRTTTTVQPAMLIISQDDLTAAIKLAFEDRSSPELERVRAVMENPSGRLVIVADAQDVRRGLHHGWGAIATYMAATETTTWMAGRLGLSLEGFDADPRALFQIPEAARWLQQLQALFPWVGAWIDPPTAFQLVGALAPFEVRNGQPVCGQSQVQAAVHIANFAVALTAREKGQSLDHVLGLLAVVGVTPPPGFFAEAPKLAERLDPIGQLVS